MKWSPREATFSDKNSIQELLVRSAIELQKDTYSKEQIHAALGPVFGVDEQMIQDNTYFVVEHDNAIVGCGGWSFREALFGGRSANDNESRCLDPRTDAARVRAFFVDPLFSRQGIGSCIMKTFEDAIIAQGFKKGEISATLVGEPLYRKFGYTTTEHYEIALAGALPLRVARMIKTYKNGEQDDGGKRDK